MKKAFSFLKKYYLSLIFVIFIFLMCINFVYGVADTTKTKYNSYYSTEKSTAEYHEEFIPLLQEQGLDLSKTDRSTQSTSQKLKKALGLTLETMQSDVDFFYIKESMLRLNAWSCKTAGMNYIPGTSYYKTNSGMLTYIPTVENSKSAIDLNINLLGIFTDATDKKGINTLYVSCPNKDFILGTETPVGLADDIDTDLTAYTNEALKTNEINYLDLWSIMSNEGVDSADLYYKTDHHWKSVYGIYAAEKIVDQLNAEYGFNIDTSIYDLSNYTEETYSDSLLGSIGINSTEAFTRAEDFSVYLPKDMGNYTFKIPSKDIDLTGDFNVFIDNDRLKNEANWPFNAYASYIYANSAYVSVKNHNIEDNHKVLIIKDSYANIVVPYLAQTIGNIDVIDIRTSQEDYFDDSVFDLIESNDYDTILFINCVPSEFKCLFKK